jgi:hypothetical protein
MSASRPTLYFMERSAHNDRPDAEGVDIDTRAHRPKKPKMSIESELATAALDTLHGARGLPSKEAAAHLRDFLDSISSPVSNSNRLSGASGALKRLVDKLEAEGSASDDDWQSAIETMLSLANETS